MVGIANEKAIFLYTGWRLPNAGAVMYWLPAPGEGLISDSSSLRAVDDHRPTKWYITDPQRVNTTTSAMVTAQSATRVCVSKRRTV